MVSLASAIFSIGVLIGVCFILYGIKEAGIFDFPVKSEQPEKKLDDTDIKAKDYLPILENSPLYSQKLAQVMVACVVGNYQSCGLVRPVDVVKHLAEMGQGVIWDKQRGFLFCYVFDRTVSIHGLKDFRYSSILVSDMAQRLNRSIGNYGRMAGVTNLQIVKQGDLPDGQVYFCLAPFSYNGQTNWQDVERYINCIQNTVTGW